MADTQPEALESFRDTKAETDLKKVHEQALKQFKQIVAREEESRILGVADLIFIDQEGGTYDEEVGFLSGTSADRNVSGTGKEPPEPRYQIDRISPVIEEAVSDQRESQINIQVRGLGETASGLSDTFNGLIKNIENVSDAPDAYDGSYDECQKSGYGGWQITTRYSDDSFEQDIFIEPILNATQSLFFGPAKKATKEDALYAFLIWDMDQDEYNAAYPDADIVEWPRETLSSLNRSWFNSKDHLIRVAAYWRKRPIKKEIIMLSDGRVIHEEDLDAALEIGATNGITIALRDGEEMRRTVDTYQVERFIMNGLEVLKGPQPWAGKYIPLIPEYGIRSVVNGTEIIRGKVRKGKDAQRIFNYVTSAIVEAGAQAPKDFFWMTPEQAEGHIKELERMNVDHNPVYYYNPDDKGTVPVKAPGPTIQQALIDQRAAAKEDISATVGANVGIADGTAADPRSGDAILAGNVNREKGNSIYFNNHIRAIRYTGIQLADLISKLWTTQQQRRIIKPDGTDELVTINESTQQQMDDGNVQTVIVNDLSQGSYDVVMDVGPAYASQRQQGADQLTKLATENPAFAANTADLIAENLDIPGSKELTKRLRRTGILDGTIDPTDEEREEFQIDLRKQIIAEITPQIREEVTNEVNIELVRANAASLQANANNLNAIAAQKEGEIDKVGAEEEKLMAERAKIDVETITEAITGMQKMLETFVTQQEAGIPLNIQDHDNRTKLQDIIEETEQDQSSGPSSAMEDELQTELDESEINQ